MICKKNKKVIHIGGPSVRDWAVDTAFSYRYNGESKIYGDRFVVSNIITSPASHKVMRRPNKPGKDIADV